jgi:hypothetical protein
MRAEHATLVFSPHFFPKVRDTFEPEAKGLPLDQLNDLERDEGEPDDKSGEAGERLKSAAKRSEVG